MCGFGGKEGGSTDERQRHRAERNETHASSRSKKKSIHHTGHTHTHDSRPPCGRAARRAGAGRPGRRRPLGWRGGGAYKERPRRALCVCRRVVAASRLCAHALFFGRARVAPVPSKKKEKRSVDWVFALTHNAQTQKESEPPRAAVRLAPRSIHKAGHATRRPPPPPGRAANPFAF